MYMAALHVQQTYMEIVHEPKPYVLNQAQQKHSNVGAAILRGISTQHGVCNGDGKLCLGFLRGVPQRSAQMHHNNNNSQPIYFVQLQQDLR